MDTHKQPIADLLLHPVRWRIVQVMQGRELTTSQLRELLTEVPHATLYRQIATLVRAEAVTIVGERKVRGAVERTYALRNEKDLINAEEGATLDHERHRRLFGMFTATLTVDFERYLDRRASNPAADDPSYRQAALYLTRQESAQLSTELNQVLAPYLRLTADPERRRYLLSTVLLPDD